MICCQKDKYFIVNICKILFNYNLPFFHFSHNVRSLPSNLGKIWDHRGQAVDNLQRSTSGTWRTLLAARGWIYPWFTKHRVMCIDQRFKKNWTYIVSTRIPRIPDDVPGRQIPPRPSRRIPGGTRWRIPGGAGWRIPVWKYGHSTY